MRLKLILFIICFMAVTSAKAATPSTSYICLSKSTGTLVVRSKCKSTEIKLTASNLGALGIQGPQGIPGPAGASSGFDVNNCYKREGTATGSGTVIAKTGCLVSEFILTKACNTTGYGIVVNELLQVADNTLLGDQMYGLYSCVGSDLLNYGSSFTVTAQALCCRGN